MIVPAIAGALLFASCATVPYQPYAREVKKRPQEGGTIALKSEHRPEDRSRADMLMASNCMGATVKVVEEGEVVVGEKSNSTAKKHNGSEPESQFSFGGVQFQSANTRATENTATTTETVQVKEWQISYNCVASHDPVAKRPSKKRK